MLEVGAILHDDYLITKILGKGGMGVVFAAKHTRLPVNYAIKVINTELREDDTWLRRFRQEAEILCSLKNDHIISVYDLNFLQNGCPYLVMELLHGEDLASRLNCYGTLPLEMALKITRQIVSALQHAHEHGIIHRDIKPANIFLHREALSLRGSEDRAEEKVKVLDFGIAKLMDAARGQLTGASALIGTPAYMSPEQALAENVDSRSDQHSLAILFFEMLAGYTPFWRPGDTPLATLHRLAYAEAPPLPSRVLDAVPAVRRDRINEALARALAKSPDHRWPSVAAFMAALGEDGECAIVRSEVSPVSEAAVAPADKPRSEYLEIGSGPSSTAVETIRPQPRFWATLSGGLLALGLIGGTLWSSQRLRSFHRPALRRPTVNAAVLAPSALSLAENGSERRRPTAAVPAAVAPGPSPPRTEAVAEPGSAASANPSAGSGHSLAGTPAARRLAVAPVPLQGRAAVREWSLRVSNADVQQAAVIKPCLELIMRILPRDTDTVRFVLKGNSSIMIEPHPAIPSRYRDRAINCLADAKRIVHLPEAAQVVMQAQEGGR